MANPYKELFQHFKGEKAWMYLEHEANKWIQDLQIQLEHCDVKDIEHVRGQIEGIRMWLRKVVELSEKN